MTDEHRPWENDPDAGSFGSWLKRQREVREISLREISEESKISIRYLEALEEDRFDVLPAQVFAHGFLREYARFVGLDPDEVVNYYISARPVEQVEDDVPTSKIDVERRGMLWPVVVILLVLVAVLSGLYWFSQQPAAEAAVPDIVPPTTPTAGTVVEVVEPATKDPIRMTLDFGQRSWVEVTVDGEKVVSELRVQGESLRRSGGEEIRIKLGNVDGVSLEINEAPFPLDVQDDEELVIDLALLRERGLLEEAAPAGDSPPTGS